MWASKGEECGSGMNWETGLTSTHTTTTAVASVVDSVRPLRPDSPCWAPQSLGSQQELLEWVYLFPFQCWSERRKWESKTLWLLVTPWTAGFTPGSHQSMWDFPAKYWVQVKTFSSLCKWCSMRLTGWHRRLIVLSGDWTEMKCP